jgi:cell division ATPase FtsA
MQSVATAKASKLIESRMSNIYNTTSQRLKDKRFREFAKAKM